MSTSSKPIIMAAFLACAGCGQAKESGTQTESETTGPAKVTTAAKAETPGVPQFDAAKVVLKGPGTALQKAYGDWKMATEPRYFGPDNLYDLINGGSEIFIAYGFQQIVTTDYRNSAHPNKTITAEVYDMKTPKGAFGRVSKYLENLTNPADAGKGLPEAMASKGILGDGDLIFWRGKYIVHLMLMDEDPAATPDSIAEFSRKTIPPIGEIIFNSLEDGAPLLMPTAFPADHIIPRSQAYLYDFEVGKNLKSSAYTARYKDGDTTWSLFVTPPATTGGGSNFVFFRTAKDTDGFVDVRSFENVILGAFTDTDPKPDKKRLKKQVDEFQANIKKILDQKTK